MGRPPKRTRFSEEEIKSKLNGHRANVKNSVLRVLRDCLEAQQTEDTTLLPDVEAALGNQTVSNDQEVLVDFDLPDEGSTGDDNNGEEMINADTSTTRYFSKRGHGVRIRTSVDEHNEVCEVCEKGGDLLCCDTCTLVFHLKCVRPIMSTVPKGEWSCSYCVLDGSADGDKATARLCTKAMEILASNGSTVPNLPPTSELALCREGAVIGEVSVLVQNRKFVLRKITKKQVVELGRYNNLEDAFGNIPTVQHIKTVLKKKRKIDESELWCTYCIDDPSMEICAFCGCKACHGKHDANLLILCDQCERETHTYCLHPPLSAVPSTDPWYCESCREKRAVSKRERQQDRQHQLQLQQSEFILQEEDNEEAQDLLNRRTIDKRSESITSGGSGGGGSGTAPVVHRGRGRPPGSGKKNQMGLQQQLDSIGRVDSSLLSVPVLGRRRSDSLSAGASSSIIPGDFDFIVEEPLGPVDDSLQNVLLIVNEANQRKLTNRDLESFEGLRMWGRVDEMEQARSALTTQRDMLLQKLALLAPEMYEDVNNRLGPFDLGLLATDFEVPMGVTHSAGELPLHASIDSEMLDPRDLYQFGFSHDSRSPEDMLLMIFKEDELMAPSPLMFGVAAGSPREHQQVAVSSSQQPQQHVYQEEEEKDMDISNDDLLKFDE